VKIAVLRNGRANLVFIWAAAHRWRYKKNKIGDYFRYWEKGKNNRKSGWLKER